MMIVNKLVLKNKKTPLISEYLPSSDECWVRFYCNLQMMVKRKKGEKR